MMMADQDHDGSHIKGLLLNFIHCFWPSLLKVPSFLVEFVTPIIKATNKKAGTVLSFYSMPEFESWRENLRGNASGWEIKYYKGLGTSSPKEGKEYFQNLDKHKKDFIWVDEQDGDAIELAFSKKKIDARKNWIRHYEPGTHLDQKKKLIKYSEFINKELILFSMADLQRSIPSMVDGLKPGQRKILFCSFKRNLVNQIKVAQFGGYVAEKSAYHHGEQNLAATIVGMAQDFVGSNNIILFKPLGQFGTRITGGKDQASPRYIFTSLSPITRSLFPKDDDNLLDYLDEDGLSIEPNWYMPIIPLVLVNGCEGIGTGWSTFIPNYNPREIVANVRRLLNGEIMESMHPWYRGFRGIIEKATSKETGYTVNGIIEEVNETTLRITELPIRRWTDDYKGFLNSITEGMRDENGNLYKDPFIKDFRSYSDDATVHFEIFLSEEKMIAAKQEGLLKKFRLTTTISTSNMHLFDPKGVIRKYDTPEQILEEFFHLRLEYYEKRKKVKLDNLELELLKLENKVRFILGVVSGEIVVNNRKRADLFLELHQKGFTPLPNKSKSVQAVVAGATDDTEETEDSSETVSTKGVQASDYDYLLSMAIGSLTLERVQQLCADRDSLNKEVDSLRKSTPKDLWVKDLDALEKLLDDLDQCDADAEKERQKLKTKAGREASKVSRQAPKNPRKYTKKSKNAEVAEETMGASSNAMETEIVPEAVKPKGTGSGNAMAEKEKPIPVLGDDDGDDEEEKLKESLINRLKAYNLDSSPDQSAAVKTDVPQGVPARKKEPTKRGASRKKPVATVSDDEDETDLDEDDDDFAVKVKKGGRKAAANAKATKPPAAAKKRGPTNKQFQALGQKLLTEMLKPAENLGVSTEKKVRKMKASPFNKKSGSLLGRRSEENEAAGREASGSASNSTEETVEVPPKARLQRAKRRQTTYVLSDSDSDKQAYNSDSDFESDQATEDSDFDGDTD